MIQLNEDIRNREFKKVYLLYGEEAYLKNQYKNRLVKTIIGEDDSMNFSRFTEKEAVPAQIIDLAETMPFFAEQRVILVENSGFFKTASPAMADYLPTMPDSTILIFVEEEVDKRNKLFKTVSAQGRAVEMNTPDERTLTKWILQILKTNKKMITQSAMELFLSRSGSGMENIENELSKLISYVGDRPSVEAEDVNMICTEQTENKVFDMINALAEGRQKIAMELYYDLLALKEPPMRIMYLISKQFRSLLQIKSMISVGMDNNRIAEVGGYRSFVIRRMRTQAGRFTTEQLKNALKDCAAFEEDVKNGRLDDRMSVELLIVKYSGK